VTFFLSRDPFYLLTVGVERYCCNWSHSDTPHLVRLLRKSDQPVTDTSTWQYTTLTRDIHALGGIWTHRPSKWAAINPHLRPRGHLYQLLLFWGYNGNENTAAKTDTINRTKINRFLYKSHSSYLPCKQLALIPPAQLGHAANNLDQDCRNLLVASDQTVCIFRTNL
jgi:hypothetical protein